MIQIDENTAIDEKFIEIDYVKSSGPGGQHVNKTSTAAQLRFDLRNCDTLPEEVKRRLAHLAGKRMTVSGELIIDARRFRSQEQNRKDALERLVRLIAKAAQPVKIRRKKKPSASFHKKRLEEKRRRGKLKKLRSDIPRD